jgi:hypothetical protein
MSLKVQFTQTAPGALDVITVAALWNAAYPSAMALSPAAVAWSLEESGGRTVGAVTAQRDGLLVGFVLASHVPGYPIGWIDALAAKDRARPAVAAGLLTSCERWLQAEGCTAVEVGGGPRSLLRGALDDARMSRIWADSGYVSGDYGDREDLALDVARYTPPTELGELAGVARPATPRDGDEVAALLADPAQLRLRAGPAAPEAALAPLPIQGRLSDLMLLWTAHGMLGLAQILFRDSATPIETAYPHTLPQPWAALGVLAVARTLPPAAEDHLLDAAIRRMHNNGVNSCVALGVEETDHFLPFGFRPYRRWLALVKPFT